MFYQNILIISKWSMKDQKMLPSIMIHESCHFQFGSGFKKNGSDSRIVDKISEPQPKLYAIKNMFSNSQADGILGTFGTCTINPSIRPDSVMHFYVLPTKFSVEVETTTNVVFDDAFEYNKISKKLSKYSTWHTSTIRSDFLLFSFKNEMEKINSDWTVNIFFPKQPYYRMPMIRTFSLTISMMIASKIVSQ